MARSAYKRPPKPKDPQQTIEGLGETVPGQPKPITEIPGLNAVDPQSILTVPEGGVSQTPPQPKEEKKPGTALIEEKVGEGPEGKNYFLGDKKVSKAAYVNQREIDKILQEGGRQAREPVDFSNIGLSPEQIQAIQSGQAQQAPINYGQAITAGTIPNLGNIAKSALYGAGGGALVGGPIGATGGAIVGAISSIYKGTVGNIRKQQAGEIGAAKTQLSLSKSNMLKLQRLASLNPSQGQEIIDLYNAELVKIYTARRQVKAEVSGNLNSWIDDGRKDLAEFDIFLEEGGQAYIYGERIRAQLTQDISPEAQMALLAEDLNE